jgi:hypothetical protein
VRRGGSKVSFATLSYSTLALSPWRKSSLFLVDQLRVGPRSKTKKLLNSSSMRLREAVYHDNKGSKYGKYLTTPAIHHPPNTSPSILEDLVLLSPTPCESANRAQQTRKRCQKSIAKCLYFIDCSSVAVVFYLQRVCLLGIKRLARVSITSMIHPSHLI